MDKTAVRKIKTKDAPTDFAYWQSRPIEERLQALEDIRNEYIAWKYGSLPRFQRVYKIIKRK